MRLFFYLASLSVSLGLVVPWTCLPRHLAPIPLPPGVAFSQLVCTSDADIPVFGKAGPLNVSVVSVDLTRPGLRLSPLTNSSLRTVDGMAASSPARNLLAGINGGYFWRIDVKTFVDGVCLGKSRDNALAAPSGK